MKKKDFILLASILVLAIGGLLAYRWLTPSVEEKGEVVISVKGKEIGRYLLYQDQEIEIPADYGTSILDIKDGNAKMRHAGCPDQVCVLHPSIHYHGDMIICLPNQIIVEVVGGEDSKLDSIAQ